MSSNTIHMIPVFALTDEPGWIILTKKKKAKIARFLSRLDEEMASWEPPVKSWFVHHSKITEAMEQIRLASEPDPVAYCHDCTNGTPCQEWAGIRDGGFSFRKPEEVIRVPQQQAASEQQNGPFAGYPETDPYSSEYVSPTVQFWVNFWKRYAGPRVRPASGPVAQQEMSEQEAAGLLAVPWPCTKEHLTASYRTAAMKAHPDHGGSTEQMAKINIARDVLMRHFQTGATG